MSFTPSALAARYGSNRSAGPPPARERLAKHSGDGSRGIVGTGFEGVDEVSCNELNLLKRGRFSSPCAEKPQPLIHFPRMTQTPISKAQPLVAAKLSSAMA
jgi:hypothetical protein